MWSRVVLLTGRLSKMQSLRGACGGLFQNADLCTPDGFPSLMERVHSECDRLCREARSPDRDRKMVEILDEMSNTICIVADTAECMRLLHPDVIYAQAAEDTVAALGTLIEELNTSSELYELVRRAVREGDVQPLDGVDRRVGELLLKDFETSGIQFPDRQRAEFVSLSRQIFASGAQFMRGCEEPTFVPSEAVPGKMRAHLRDAGGSQYALYSALLDNGDTDVRRFGYKMYYSPLASQEALLRTLLSCRGRQASLVGYGSYADRALQSMLLNHGSTVAAFLEATLDAVRAQAFREIRLLERYAGRASEKSNVWDWPYMTYMARYKMFELNASSVLPYLKLENVVHNLSIILDQLYGVHIDVQPTEDGEVWHESVTKWVVRDGGGRSLGLIYCDWYDRLGKVGESHFTIRCSKRLPDGSQQLPVVVLSFRMAKWSDEETYLSQSQLENLLHEVGHALHSLFGRTRYQHVAGTRCSTDFAEVPSNLMEKWAWDRRMLSALTGGQMPDNLVDKWCASRRSFGAMELAQQCLLALVDLRLHHTYNADEPIEDTVRFCRSLYEEAGFGDWMPEGTAWHHRLSHLVPYGSKYSSYLVARGAASLLWRHCFAEEPLSSRAGSHWRRVQAYGGEKGSADLLQDAIGYVPSPASLADALQLDVRPEPL